MGPNIIALSWIECAIALLFVSARMYTRIKVIHNVGWDDWTIVISFVSVGDRDIHLRNFPSELTDAARY